MKKEKALRHFHQKIIELATLNEDNFTEVTRWLSLCRDFPNFIDSIISNPLLPDNVQLEYTKRKDHQLLNVLGGASTVYTTQDSLSLDWCSDCFTQLSKAVSTRWIESLPPGLRKSLRWSPTKPVKLSVIEHDIKLSSVLLRRSWLRPIPPLSNVTFEPPHAVLRTGKITEFIDDLTGKTIESLAGHSMVTPDKTLCTLTNEGLLSCSKDGNTIWERTYGPYLALDVQRNFALLFDESVIHIVELETGLNLATVMGSNISRCIRNRDLFVLRTNDSFEIDVQSIDSQKSNALVLEDFELIEYFWGLSIAVHLCRKTNKGSNILLTLDWQTQVVKKHMLPPGEWLDVMEHLDTIVILYKVNDATIAIEVNSIGDITQMRPLRIKHPTKLLTMSPDFLVMYSIEGAIHCVDRAQFQSMWHLDASSPTGLPQAIFWKRGLALFSSRLELVEPDTGRRLGQETFDYLETVSAHYCGEERFVITSKNGYLLGIDASGFLANLPQIPR